MTEIEEGQILAGKYRVERVLGTGGMGVVVAATHLQLEERVAIKFLLPEALANEEAVARFAREARAAVKIKGEHVARVIDVGTFETGEPYMVMEYLEGRDLAAVIHERRALPIREAVDYMLQACEALAEAHSLGIIHRDLKPPNLFLTHRPDGTPSIKVLDFGISKVKAGGSDHSVTKTSAIMGSPLYMSPEQMTAARDVDSRSDIWSIGAILYELLAGKVPFDAESLPQICGLILSSAPRPVRDFRPDVSEELQQVVMRCLSKDRDGRFANVGELAAALTKFGSRMTSRSVERIGRILTSAGVNTSALKMVPTSVPAPTMASTQAAWGSTQAPRRRAVPILLGGAAALAALGLVGAFALGRGASSEASSPPAAESTAPAQPPERRPAAASPLVEPASDVGAELGAVPSASATPPSPSASGSPGAEASAAPPAAMVTAKAAASSPAKKTWRRTTPRKSTAKKKKTTADLLSGRH